MSDQLTPLDEVAAEFDIDLEISDDDLDAFLNEPRE